MTTRLSTSSTPGRNYGSFVGKTVASGKGAGSFTALSVLGIPGQQRTFVAKIPASGGAKGTGPFTWLDITGLPGGRRTFIAKTAAVPPVIPEVPQVITGGGGGSGFYTRRYERQQYREPEIRKFKNDDNEVIEILTILFSSGVIN